MNFTSIKHLTTHPASKKRGIKNQFLFAGVLFFSLLVTGLVIINLMTIQQQTRIINQAKEKPSYTPTLKKELSPSQTTVTISPTSLLSPTVNLTVTLTVSPTVTPTVVHLQKINTTIPPIALNQLSPTVQSTCNMPCLLNTDCPGSFICSEEFKKCRNPSCPYENTCICQITPSPTSIPSPTTTISPQITITNTVNTITTTKKPVELPAAGNALLPLLISTPFILIFIGMLL